MGVRLEGLTKNRTGVCARVDIKLFKDPIILETVVTNACNWMRMNSDIVLDFKANITFSVLSFTMKFNTEDIVISEENFDKFLDYLTFDVNSQDLESKVMIVGVEMFKR